MTIAEMHTAFKIGVQDYASHLNRSFHPEEIDHYLNEAIEDFLRKKFSSINNQGFEQNFKRIEDLRTLVVSNHEIDCIYNSQQVVEGFTFDTASIPANWLYMISIRAIVKDTPYTIINGKRVSIDTPSTVKVKWVQHDDLYRVLDDPFNDPVKECPIVAISGSEIHAFCNDTFIVDQVVVNYLKQPATVSLSRGVDCDLADSTHRQIVDTAVLISKGESGKLGTQVEYSLINKDNEP